MEDHDPKEVRKKLLEFNKACGIEIFTKNMNTFKAFSLLSHPDILINIQLGVTKSIIEMLLRNIHEVNLNKFKNLKANILAKIDALKKEVEKIGVDPSSMYG